MKLSNSSTFDVAEIANTNSFREIEPFFDFFNSFSTDVIQAMNKKVTLGDNLDYSSIPLVVKHGIGINIGQLDFQSYTLKSASSLLFSRIAINSDNSKSLYVYFKNPVKVRAKSAIWQVGNAILYKLDDNSYINTGDEVTFSGFGTAANNGTYLVIGKNTSNGVYVSSYTRASNTADETKTGFVGESADTYPITLGLFNR